MGENKMIVNFQICMFYNLLVFEIVYDKELLVKCKKKNKQMNLKYFEVL